MDRPAHPDPLGRIGLEPLQFYAVLALTLVLLGVFGPVLTSDGPAHLAMAHFIRHAHDGSLPMLSKLYELNPYPAPNLAGHWLLVALMSLFEPLAAENALQLFCVGSVPLAARLLLGRMAPQARWLAVFFIPVGLQRMFFLGLYNFCLSVTGFLLCLWAYLRLRESRRAGDAVLLGALSLLTLACHAGGWVEAGLAVAVLLFAEAALRWRSGAGWDGLPRVALFTTLAAVPSLLAMVLHTLRLAGLSGADGVPYHFNPWFRLWAIARGDPYATIGITTAAVAVVFNAVLLGLCIRSGSRQEGRSAAILPLALSQALRWALPAGLLLFALLVPSSGGGGWTHDWRAAVFPYITLALACAVGVVPPALRRAAGWVGAIGSLFVLASTVEVQARHLPPVVAAFDRIGAMVPPRCTLAPVFENFKLDAANSARLVYHPLFHLSNRIGLTGDRPVLFNYLARLPVYPVRFRDGSDPQALLYGWKPMQSATHIEQFDVMAFERTSTLGVDFVLLHDVPAAPPDGPYREIRERLRADFVPVARDGALGLELLARRPARAGCEPLPAVSAGPPAAGTR